MILKLFIIIQNRRRYSCQSYNAANTTMVIIPYAKPLKVLIAVAYMINQADFVQYFSQFSLVPTVLPVPLDILRVLGSV